MIKAEVLHFSFWSVAIPLALVSGFWLTLKRAKEVGLDSRKFENRLYWGVGIGFVISHMFEVLFYREWTPNQEGFLELIKVWNGLSSYGGFIGAFLGFTIVFWKQKGGWWREADFIMQGLSLAWIFGRLGCTVAGDHPGNLTDFFLAYPYPEGPRHNLGMYEMIFTLVVLFPSNLYLHRFKPPVGSFVALNCIVYGIGRIGLDFFRSSEHVSGDPRYATFTLAQYLSAGVILFGLLVLLKVRGKGFPVPDVEEK